MSQATLDEARKWIAAAVEAHALGEWSRSAASARIGLATAALAEAEFSAARQVEPVGRRVRTVEEAFGGTQLRPNGKPVAQTAISASTPEITDAPA